MRDFKGKTAVVTGGVSGIGLGIAKAFASAGMRVVVTYRRDDHLEKAMREFAARPDWCVRPVRLDVTDRADVERAAAQVEELFGNIHILCNNAGVNLLGPMDTAVDEDWRWIIDVNLYGVIHGLQSFLPRIKAHGEGGYVITVGSMASFIPGPGAGIYTASKFAVRGLMECLRYNLAPHGIGVSLVCPGLTRSNIFESPLRRPERYARGATTPDGASLERLAAVHASGMDPDEVGAKTLDGIRRNDFYVFTHPEFRDEMRQLCDELIACFREEPVSADRLMYEELRRSAKARAEQQIAQLRAAVV